MQRRAATLVDALQEAQRPEADRAVRKRVAEVLDDVERDRNMEPGGDALAMVVGVQAACRIPVLRHPAARLRVESARHHQRSAREARLELERDRDHRLRGGAAAVEEHEQVLCRVLWGGREAEDPAGGHWKNW